MHCWFWWMGFVDNSGNIECHQLYVLTGSVPFHNKTKTVKLTGKGWTCDLILVRMWNLLISLFCSHSWQTLLKWCQCFTLLLYYFTWSNLKHNLSSHHILHCQLMGIRSDLKLLCWMLVYAFQIWLKQFNCELANMAQIWMWTPVDNQLPDY